MNVKEIVLDYLSRNSYEGLFNEDSECGCSVDDFMPCSDGMSAECQPGFRLSGNGECDFLIGPKPEHREAL